MDVTLFFRAVLIGLSIAAPVGPIGVLCIRRTLANGWAAGLASGLGAATADGLYGCVGAFGLTVVSYFLVSQQLVLRLAGGAFLIFLGARTFLSRPAADGVKPPTSRLLGLYASTFLLTVTNPLTILSFAAVFAGLGLGRIGGDFSAAVLLVAGVFLGSALWWLLLSGGVSMLRRHFNTTALIGVNRISGALILLFGVAAIVSLVV